MKNSHLMLNHIYKVSISTLLCLLICFVLAPAVNAEDIRLEVSPAREIIELTEPNTEKTMQFSLKNHSNHPETVKFELFPIEKVDKSTNRPIYQSIQSLSETQQSFYTNAISFHHQGKVVPEIHLAPQSEENVELKVRHNNDQTSSEYHFTVGFITKPAVNVDEQTTEDIHASLAVQGGVGSHVIVSFGNSLSEVIIQDIEGESPDSPVPNVILTLNNRTSKPTKIYGNISITNILGIQIASFDTDEIILLGNETKKVNIAKDSFSAHQILKSLSVGSNTIKVQLFNTSSKQRIYGSESFFYVPAQFFLLLLVLGIIVILVKRKLRKKGL